MSHANLLELSRKKNAHIATPMLHNESSCSKTGTRPFSRHIGAHKKKCVFVDNYKINGLNHSWNTLCFIRNETHCGRIIGCTLHQSKFLNQFRMFNEHPHCIDCQYFAFNTECLSIRDHLGKTMKAVSLF